MIEVELGEIQEDVFNVAVARVLGTSQVWISLQQSYRIIPALV